MRFSTIAREEFEASHTVEGNTLCGRLHGHFWDVEVTVEGGLDPKKMHVVDHGELATALEGVVAEFSDRDLNDMLPGTVTTPEGIALYIRERLILDWPHITSVAVSMGPKITVRLVGETR